MAGDRVISVTSYIGQQSALEMYTIMRYINPHFTYLHRMDFDHQLWHLKLIAYKSTDS